MASRVQRIFARYSGFLRTLKASYVVNNWLNSGQLQHNKNLYRKYGLHKSIFSPVGEKDFTRLKAGDTPWVDRPDALQYAETMPEFQAFSPQIQEKVRQFITDGFLVLENFVPANQIDQLNSEVDHLLKEGKVGFNFTGRKIFNLFEISQLANDQFFRRPELLQLLNFLLGRKVVPFQSLNFQEGSEQRAHSDLIHMTTYPAGYLIAAWYALEPCTPDNGPVAYYPGSHRLPFVGTKDYNSGNGIFVLGTDSNKKYEDKIEEIIQTNHLKKTYFLAQPGDVLVWHANLIHAGSPIMGRHPDGSLLTRKSMVCHYFAEDVICYHEMLQRPALIKKQ